ncbi:MAG: glycosyltransferase, partial [Chloroflexi bacterium]|nr:glycosyltransferase [Chloroflexota bacterium]
MFTPVPTTPKSLEEYRGVIEDEKIEEIRSLAEPLRGARVLHVNATAFGGGVAELLGTLVSLMNDVGLETEWQVIQGADEFFKVTKAMHNALQGAYKQWTPECPDMWIKYNALNAKLFDEKYDFVVIHDPQPAGIRHFVNHRNGCSQHGKWIWRCHIDLTEAQPDVWNFLRPYVELHDAAIFTLPDYVKGDLKVPLIAIIPPSIDPFSPKNVPLSPEAISENLRTYGIPEDKPIICQVSRFDPWKDPLGVIDVYRAVKQEIPDLQLVLVASMASDDPEGWSFYEKTARHAGNDFDIHLMSNLLGFANSQVNAIQRASKVVIQKSIREGFGLVVAEALWKGTPVVAGNVGGIPLQVIDGVDGYLVSNRLECAHRVLELLQHRSLARQYGEAGREHVRRNFLSTRNLYDYLQVFNKVAKPRDQIPPVYLSRALGKALEAEKVG